MAIPLKPKQDPQGEDETCLPSDPTCSSTEQQPQQPEEQQQQAQEQAPQQPQPQEEPVAEGIRTIPIPIPGGKTGEANVEVSEGAPSAAPSTSSSAPQAQPQGPGMRNLVRFLNNPPGAMAGNNSNYLRTMYSTDSAELVSKSAMNSSSYYWIKEHNFYNGSSENEKGNYWWQWRWHCL